MTDHCEGKTPFKTKGDAQTAVARMRKHGALKRPTGHSGKITAFYCDVCGFFHHGPDSRTTKYKRRKNVGRNQ